MEKSKTRQEIADEYGIDRKTLYSMLKKEATPPSWINFPKAPRKF